MRKALLVLALAASACFGADRKLKAVIIDGLNNHDWAAGTNAIRGILEGSGRFTVDVSTWPKLPDFSRYDVVVNNFNGGHTEQGTRWPAEAERALESYVRGGGGLVIFHAANNAFLEWPEYNRMIGLGWRVPAFGPGVAIDSGQVHTIPKGQGLPPGHGPRHDFELIVLDKQNPITRGLPDRWPHPSEQLTHGQHGPAEGLTVLTYAVSEVSHHGEPMDWVRDYGKGRVYTTMLGHTWKDEPNPNLDDPNFQTLFARGAEWAASAQVTIDSVRQPANQPDRLEWFRDQGFGLFIHWSVDSQLGTVISHSLVGASEDYTSRFFTELPKTFNPRKFYPEDWAVLAKLAGVRYVVFTAKHHSGFAMWPTKTTPYGILNTPFQKDIVADVLQAFRKQGIAPGLYFSPDDFHWLYENHVPIARGPDYDPPRHPGLLALDQAQLKELMTGYGPIDVVFLDGEAEGLKQVVWQAQPKTVITRGAMTTPEQTIPGAPLDGPWEACITMGTSWQYQPRNETYKSGYELIRLIYETRAKGGNLLLNVGPKPDGELPIEQEERLRELALWMFINGEAVYGVRPWTVTNEQNIWFTKKKNENTLYAVIAEPWKRGDWKDIVLHSVKSTPKTEVNVLGQNDQVYEYTKIVPKTTWKQEADGLHVRAMFAQRLQDNGKWPNPLVLKLTNVEPAARR